MNERESFYRKVVSEQIKDKNCSILVCGGGGLDRDVLADCGFTDVTISNLDERMEDTEYAPFRWKRENAQSLSFVDEAYDYVIIHAAMHHADSPHRVITEMYRVARKGVLAIESRDSLMMRIFERFKFTQTYECSSVYFNNCTYGGTNNTDIPNYIYRWTEREVEKTIKSYAPHAKHRFFYKYGNAFPSTPEVEKKGKAKYLLLKAGRSFYRPFVKLFPRQQNLFAFYIEKPMLPKMLHPWLKYNEDRIYFNREWGDREYKRGK